MANRRINLIRYVKWNNFNSKSMLSFISREVTFTSNFDAAAFSWDMQWWWHQNFCFTIHQQLSSAAQLTKCLHEICFCSSHFLKWHQVISHYYRKLAYYQANSWWHALKTTLAFGYFDPLKVCALYTIELKYKNHSTLN